MVNQFDVAGGVGVVSNPQGFQPNDAEVLVVEIEILGKTVVLLTATAFPLIYAPWLNPIRATSVTSMSGRTRASEILSELAGPKAANMPSLAR